MKLVENEGEFLEQLASAKREAMSAVGDDVVLLERYIKRPRHIELQVFGDKLGNCVHLFERDCSIQRRYQKVLEESPAPGLSQEMRHKMGSSAVDAARAVNYVGAGTVEFIFDCDTSEYYFMEMNTRLQVEHPVTEMVTGQDLVKWQLRVASGYPLPMTQTELDEMGPQGHAIEARVYAEDPAKDFIPQTGQIRHLRQPEGDGVRVDTGIVEGDSVTPFYDPMISKLIVWDTNRAEALRKMHSALDAYEIVGLNNNIPFLSTCSSHPAFARGDVDTDFIPKYHDELFASSAPAEGDFKGQILAAVVSSLFNVNSGLVGYESPFGPVNAGFRPNSTMGDAAQSKVTLKDEHGTVSVDVSVLGMNHFLLTLPDGSQSMTSVSVDSNDNRKFTASIDGNNTNFSAFVERDQISVWCGSNRWTFEVPVPSWAEGDGVALSAGSLVAPMPGRITGIKVAAGDKVEAGDVLITMEAMKMEHSIRAPEKGVVGSLAFEVGDLVEGGSVLAVVDAA